MFSRRSSLYYLAVALVLDCLNLRHIQNVTSAGFWPGSSEYDRPWIPNPSAILVLVVVKSYGFAFLGREGRYGDSVVHPLVRQAQG